MNTIIPAKEIAASILKIMEEAVSKYPEKDRVKLKAIMLGELGFFMFNGPKEKEKK
jgi:hypothetical protein